MTLHNIVTLYRLKELENYDNKYTISILHTANNDNLDATFKNLLECKNTTNKELTIIFDTMTFYYTRTNVDIAFCKHYVDYTFILETKDLDIALLSYFKFIHQLYKTVDFDVEFVTKYFQKCYDAISNKITRSAILKEIYFYLKYIMKKEMHFLHVFMKNKYYSKFLLFNIFFNDFYTDFSDEETVELFLNCKHDFQREMLIHGRIFNNYLLMLKPEYADKMSITSLFYLFEYSIFFNKIIQWRLESDVIKFIYLLHNFIGGEKTDIETCIFKNIHSKRINLKNAICEFNEALTQFIMSRDLSKLSNLFKNSMYFLRANENTDLRVLGEFIGKFKNQKYLKMFCSTFDTANDNLIGSLRIFLSSFVLPSESQAIVRVLEQFSEHFYNSKIKEGNDVDVNNLNAKLNVVDITEADYKEENVSKSDFTPQRQDIYIIVYSLIMLNTNLHNVNIKFKISKKNFIDNMRKCKISDGFDNKYLGDLFDDIRKNPFKFVDRNHYGQRNYQAYKLAIENIADDENRQLLDCLRPKDYTINIDKNICNDCTSFAYRSIFTDKICVILDNVFNRKSMRHVKLLLDICKYYNAIDINYKVMKCMFDNFREEMLEPFLSFYMSCIENHSVCENSKHSDFDAPKVFALPFLIIQKHYISLQIEKNALFKKDNLIMIENEKSINKFIRNSASISDVSFTKLIMHNIHIEDQYTTEKMFEVVLKNAFRAHLILSPEFMLVLSNSDLYLSLFVEKIIELRLKSEILETLKCLQAIKYSIENIIFSIVKNAAEIIDEELAKFILEIISNETNVHFNILLHLQKSYESFEYISGNMINTIYNSIKRSENKIDFQEIIATEMFSKYLAEPGKFITYCLSSKENINFRVLEKIEAQNLNKCIYNDTESLNVIYRQITYVMIKCSSKYTHDIKQYYMAYLKALSKQTFLLLFYLMDHLWIFLSINISARSLLLQHTIHCINQYLYKPWNCKCGVNHDIDKKINVIIKFLIDKKLITSDVFEKINYNSDDHNDGKSTSIQSVDDIVDNNEDKIYEL